MADRVKLHHQQICTLQVEMVMLDMGLRSLIVTTNFHLYSYHMMSMAQITVFCLLVGMNDLELNIDKIAEYLRIMATQRATLMVIPPESLRKLLAKITHQLRPNPRLKLSYD